MIRLTTLSGTEFYLNTDLVVKIEALPDTVITLTDGKTMRVTERPEIIIDRIIAYKRKIYAGSLEV
ncbi:flagellar FlbD family protein [Proteiniclasticum sp. C24MP]|uniref:flagellar FlbD family protein n=1 Tax=Proteiniclasticum sp. C24MP TaxID=3374101 RepID=UPI00375407D6